MIFINYEILINFLNKTMQKSKEKFSEILRKEILAMRVQRIWKVYNVNKQNTYFFLFRNI